MWVWPNLHERPGSLQLSQCPMRAVHLTRLRLHRLATGQDVGGAGNEVRWAWWDVLFGKDPDATVHQPVAMANTTTTRMDQQCRIQ